MCLFTRWPVAIVIALPLLAFACTDEGAGGGVEIGSALCADQKDNDGDGFIDCQDQDCWGEATCAEPGDVTAGSDGLADDTILPPDTSDLETIAGDVGPTGPACDPCGAGSLVGKACAPSEAAAIAGATATVRGTGCDGQPFEVTARSAADGTYTIGSVPCGTHTVEIRSGSFARTFEVQVASGQTTNLATGANKGCFLKQAAKLAVLKGTWDEIQLLLLRLGLDYDLYTDDGVGAEGEIVALLSDPELMATYDVIFANCGHTHGGMPKDHPEVMANVRDFVLGGGSLYMSDYAWTYGEWAFPDAVEFQRSDDVLDMYTPRSPQLIPSGVTVTERVLDGQLAGYLGRTTLPVTFDSGPQIAPEKAGTAFAHVIATFPANLGFGTDFITENVPLVLSHVPANGAGRVIYTNFHNDVQATEDMLKLLTYLVFTL